MRFARYATVLLLLGCREAKSGTAKAEPVAPPPAPGLTLAQVDTLKAVSAPVAPGSALALRVNDTIAVWYVASRADTGASGKPCIERVMEIRNGVRTIPVPLLYTGEVPVLLRGSSMAVHVWRHCAPTDLYRVNLQTGQPLRVIE